jgi:hypothetical protein
MPARLMLVLRTWGQHWGGRERRGRGRGRAAGFQVWMSREPQERPALCMSHLPAAGANRMAAGPSCQRSRAQLPGPGVPSRPFCRPSTVDLDRNAAPRPSHAPCMLPCSLMRIKRDSPPSAAGSGCAGAATHQVLHEGAAPDGLALVNGLAGQCQEAVCEECGNEGGHDAQEREDAADVGRLRVCVELCVCVCVSVCLCVCVSECVCVCVCV